MVMSQDFFDLGIEGGTCWNFNDHSEVKNGIKMVSKPQVPLLQDVDTRRSWA